MGAALSKPTPQDSPPMQSQDSPALETQSDVPPSTDLPALDTQSDTLPSPNLPVAVAESLVQARARTIAERHPDPRIRTAMLNILAKGTQDPENVSMLDKLQKMAKWVMLQEQRESGINARREMLEKVIRCLGEIDTRWEEYQDLEELKDLCITRRQHKMRKLLNEIEGLNMEKETLDQEDARARESAEGLQAEMDKSKQEMSEAEQELKEIFGLEYQVSHA